MEEIAHQVFIEKDFRGVVLGAIILDQGLILVDAPIQTEDILAWKTRIEPFGGGFSNKLLVMMDTHIDRITGMRACEVDILGHQNAIEILSNRALMLQAQDVDCGAAYAPEEAITNIPWPVPNLSFSDQISFYWDDDPVIVTHQPGAHSAGVWVDCREKQVVFVGDSVVMHQPPFLACADLDLWIAELTLLNSDVYKGYKIVSSRSGLVTRRTVDWMTRFLITVREMVAELAESEERSEAIAKAVPILLRRTRFDKVYANSYKNRLVWGLTHYLQRHYPEDLN